MFRLVFFLIFLVAIVTVGFFALSIGLSVWAIAAAAGAGSMPSPIQKIAYAALVVLLIGLSLGWLGGI